MISKRDVLEIACKVLGLTCLIWGIAYLSSALVTPNRTAFTYIVTPSLCWLISALVLLKWAGSIAHLLVSDDRPVELKEGGEWKKSLYTLSLRIVGAVAFVKAVPATIRAILEIVFRSRIPSANTVSVWLTLIWAVVYLVLGIYLIGGAKELVRISMKGSLRERNSNNV